MTVLIKIIQLILSLSLLVIVHEFGHFITARIFKTRVTKFYIFFDTKFSLFKCKRFNGKWHFKFFGKTLRDMELVTDGNGEPVLDAKGNKQYQPIDISKLPDNDWRKYPDNTEFGIGWIPFGGYCAICGMVDETHSAASLASEPQPYEFRSKKRWQRLIIILAGVIMNVITAMAIYIGLLSHYGEAYLPNSSVKYGIAVDSVGYEMGLRNGDYILSVDNEEVEDFYAIPSKILIDQAKTIQVLRDGQQLDIEVSEETLAKLMKATSLSFIAPRIPFVVGGFSDDSPAKNAGIAVDDQVISVDGQTSEYFDQFKEIITNSKGQTVNIIVVRDSDTLSYPVQVSDNGLVGVYANTTNIFEIKQKDFTFFQAISAGCKQAFTQMGSYVKSLKLLFLPKAKGYESLGSFISIANIFPGTWDWYSFWRLTAFLSIILAIMNVLPIPALDGGYAILIIYEMITGKKPSDKFLEKANTIGWIILLALLLLATWNDVTKYIFRIR